MLFLGMRGGVQGRNGKEQVLGKAFLLPHRFYPAPPPSAATPTAPTHLRLCTLGMIGVPGVKGRDGQRPLDGSSLWWFICCK